MQPFLSIFFWLIFNEVGTVPMGSTEWKKYHLTATNKHKVLQPLIMGPSENLTKFQIEQMVDNCKGVLKKCFHAEECCTMQCVKTYNRCVHFWT